MNHVVKTRIWASRRKTGRLAASLRPRFPPWEQRRAGVVPNALPIRGSAPSWRRSSIGNEEPGSALAAGLWGAAALPVDSRIKSYSQHRNTIIQAEGERLRRRNTDEGRKAGKHKS